MDGETNTLYRNHSGSFVDATPGSGLDRASLRHTSYGVAFVDPDLNGDLDPFVANGAMQLFNAWAPAGSPDPLPEPDQLLLQRSGVLQEVAEPVLERWQISRGVAAGDLDDDGAIDLLVTSVDGSLRVLRAQPPADGRWLGLRIVDAGSGRDLLGAEVVLELADGSHLLRHVHSDGSYASASDPRVVFGLTGRADPVSVTVRAPGSSRPLVIATPPMGRYTTVSATASR
jgi:hypothetical protein